MEKSACLDQVLRIASFTGNNEKDNKKEIIYNYANMVYIPRNYRDMNNNNLNNNEEGKENQIFLKMYKFYGWKQKFE